MIYVRARRLPSLSRLLSFFLLNSDGNDLRPISIVHALLLFLSHEHVSECEYLALRTARKTAVSVFRVTTLRAACEIIVSAGFWNSTQNLFPSMIAETRETFQKCLVLSETYSRTRNLIAIKLFAATARRFD